LASAFCRGFLLKWLVPLARPSQRIA
jgi:hypothetical protein